MSDYYIATNGEHFANLDTLSRLEENLRNDCPIQFN